MESEREKQQLRKLWLIYGVLEIWEKHKLQRSYALELIESIITDKKLLEEK